MKTQTYEITCESVLEHENRKQAQFRQFGGPVVDLKILSTEKEDVEFIPGRSYTIEIKEAK